MALTDDDLTRQLESVPLVDPPSDLRETILTRVAAGVPAHRARATRTPARRLILGLAWAAAAVIVIGVAVERASLPHSQSAATVAPLPLEEWPVVARVSSQTEKASLTVRRNGDRFAVRGVAAEGRPSIDWDREKLSMIEVLPDSTVVLQRRPEATGSAVVRLSVAGREILKITNFL